MKTSEYIGKQIAKHRKSFSFSQETLSRKAGLSTGSLSRIERGIQKPNLDTLDKLAKALGFECGGELLV